MSRNDNVKFKLRLRNYSQTKKTTSFVFFYVADKSLKHRHTIQATFSISDLSLGQS